MRYCFNCTRVTLGSPRFCNFCGRSYDAKLCPRLHVNPREAAVCSECGSRDLTTPHPKPSLWLRSILVFLSVLPGILLLLLSVAFLALYIYALLTRPALQFRFMLLGLVLSLLWLLYIELPRLVRGKLASRRGWASKRDE